MRYPWFVAANTAALFILGSARMLFAGVVMAETSTAHGANGETFSVNRTIYVQGNKQKVERKNITEVTDLDKRVIYVIDKHDRVYTEIPLQALRPTLPGDIQRETIHLSKTGETRVIADQPCDEYRTVEGNQVTHVTISACVSAGTPGAKEVSEFERKMVARLSDREAEHSTSNTAASLMLEKQSVLSFRVPDPSGVKAYRTASLLAETRVNKIQLKPLPPETFKPPKGYSKLRNQPTRTAPPNPLEAPDSIVDANGQVVPFSS
jgi:hypothetical protein